VPEADIRVTEASLPSQTEAKLEMVSGPVPRHTRIFVEVSATVGKMKGRVISDLVKNIPLFTDADREKISLSLIQLKRFMACGFTDFEFLSLFVSTMSVRVAQIVQSYQVGTHDWVAFCYRSISHSPPPPGIK
jgi:hypothetical protein